MQCKYIINKTYEIECKVNRSSLMSDIIHQTRMPDIRKYSLQNVIFSVTGNVKSSHANWIFLPQEIVGLCGHWLSIIVMIM